MQKIDCIVNAQDAAPQVLTYRAERRLSRDLRGCVGQCLDYRTGKSSQHNLAWMDGIADMVVARDGDDQPRFNALLYGAVWQRNRSQAPVLTLDTSYSPDGSSASWEKLAGMLRFAAERAAIVGLPLVVPPRSMVGYEDQAFRYLQSIVTSPRTVARRDLRLKIAPGVSGSLYVEIDGFIAYHELAHVTLSKALVVQASKRRTNA